MLEVMKDIALFSDLSDADLSQIACLVKIRNYKKNTIVVTQGEDTNSVYIVVSGRLRVYRDSDEGHEVILNELHKASCFGELAILAETTRSASVVTLEPSTLGVISKPDIDFLLSENPRLTLGLAKYLAKRVVELSDDVSDFAMLDVYGRVARTLEKHAIQESDRLITGRFTHQEVAAMVGASREMVSKILKELRVGGYISMDGKRVVLEKRLPKAW